MDDSGSAPMVLTDNNTPPRTATAPAMVSGMHALAVAAENGGENHADGPAPATQPYPQSQLDQLADQPNHAPTHAPHTHQQQHRPCHHQQANMGHPLRQVYEATMVKTLRVQPVTREYQQ